MADAMSVLLAGELPTSKGNTLPTGIDLNPKNIPATGLLEWVYDNYIKRLDKRLYRGSGRKVVCPIHDDRGPSMQFYTSTETFHCFGCLETGDVEKLIRKSYEKYGYDGGAVVRALGLEKSKSEDKEEINPLMRPLQITFTSESYIRAVRKAIREGRSVEYLRKLKLKYMVDNLE